MSAPRRFRASLSAGAFVDVNFAKGHVFVDGDTAARTPHGLQELFRARGSTELYYRVPTRRRFPGEGPIDWALGSLQGCVERARQAAELGLDFNPEFGLFMHYGDLGRQPPPDFSEYPEIPLPGPWASLDATQMVDALRRYGEVAAREVLGTGVTVSVWDIGNEVDAGIAGVAPPPAGAGETDQTDHDSSAEVNNVIDRGRRWYAAPDRVDPEIARQTIGGLFVAMSEAERIAWLGEHVWPHQARLMGAFADGVRSVDPQARFCTHLSDTASASPAFTTAFWTVMREGGYLADEIGLSYYPSRPLPFPGTRLESFFATVRAVRETFDRPVFLGEYSYPAVADGVYSNWTAPLHGYPLGEQGQHDLLRDLTAWGAQTGYLSGIRPWNPDGFVGVFGWGPMSLFKFGDAGATTALARTAIGAMQAGLTAKALPFADRHPDAAPTATAVGA
jgi:arabinogalactan endo-1,4-beta-galactosidase